MNFQKNLPGYYLIRIVWMIFIFITVESTGQNENYLNSIIKSTISTEARVTKIDSLLRNLEAKQDDSLHYWYQIYAYWLFDIKKKKEAIVNEKKAYEFAKVRPEVKLSFVQRSGIYLAFYYEQNGQHLNSIETYKEVVLIENTSKYAITAYLNLGYSYLKIHDYYNAIEHFELAIILLEGESKNLKALREAHQNIAATSIKIRTPEAIFKGRYHGKLADSLAQIIPTSDSNKYKIKYALAQLYSREEAFDFPNASKYYDEVHSMLKKTQDTSKLITSYLGYGILYKNIDQNKSIAYLERANQFIRPKDSFLNYQIYTTLGYNYGLKNELTKSIELRHKGLSLLSGNSFTDYESIEKEFLINSDRKTNLLYALPRLADCYLSEYKKEKDPTVLVQSLAYFEMADNLIDLIRINSREFKSRLFWRELSATVYSKAIHACFLNSDKEKAFYYMEKNKGLLLMEDLARQDFRNSLKLESKVLYREKDLRTRIQLIDSKLKDPSTLNDSLKKYMLDLKIELSQLQDSIFGPDKTLDLDTKILTMQELQESLDVNEVFIEYHISIDNEAGFNSKSEVGFAFVVQKDATEFIEIKELTKLKSELIYLIDALKNPFKTADDKDQYKIRSFNAYNLLFPSVEIQNMIKGKKLILSTDSYLSLFPFDALSTSKESLSYLINDTQIRYLYSYSFLQNTVKDQNEIDSFVGFAPQDFNEDYLTPLYNSGLEIEELNRNFDGKSFYHTEATKMNFLKNLSQASIVHLATHANVQDSISPWIAFYDEKISLDELYLTQNNASLVVLSGCNTTLGEQAVGEGVMSLARGFFYGGAQSVVSTLWSIDDKSTAAIVADFYDNLGSGQTKATALHNAKINYLNTHTLSETSPYYWASFVLLGDNDPIPATNSNWIYYLLISLGAVLLFFTIRFLRK